VKFGDAMRMATNTDWIKPRYYAYLKGKRNVAVEQQVTVAMLSIPERDRTKSWGASGAGKCLRQRQFSWIGLPQQPPDEHSLNIFLNGTWLHMRHQAVGMAAGYLDDLEVPLENKQYNLRGTMDAIDSTGIPVEYKSINQNGFAGVRAYGVRADHNQQLHSYFLAGGFTQGRVLYENKNTNDILEFHVTADTEVLYKVRDDLDTLNLATHNQYLLPMLDECTRKEGAYRWCPYASQCLTAGRDLSWRETPGTLDIPATFSSDSVSPMSPSQLDSLRTTDKSSLN